jgi:predicted nucleotidyltransferase
VKIEFGRDWSEFLKLLISHRVRFVLVGGHAVAGHGEPRFTEDLDVFVDATIANARRVREALIAFGFSASVPAAAALAAPGKVWMIGRKPWRIDLLTSIDGVVFRDAWKGRISVDFDGQKLPIIGLDELIRNKKAAGRPKDLADVSALVSKNRVRGGATGTSPQRRVRPTKVKKH